MLFWMCEHRLMSVLQAFCFISGAPPLYFVYSSLNKKGGGRGGGATARSRKKQRWGDRILWKQPEFPVLCIGTCVKPLHIPEALGPPYQPLGQTSSPDIGRVGGGVGLAGNTWTRTKAPRVPGGGLCSSLRRPSSRNSGSFFLSGSGWASQ